MAVATLKAPFPYFGGKSRVAAEVWRRFGDVYNYVEPFAGSLAVLLARPTEPRVETVNDKDGFISNFWRAVQADPEAVAHYADWPVNENDKHARHAWLVSRKDSLQERLEGDPEFYDAKVAGWWVWGACLYIGSGWCSGTGPWRAEGGRLVNMRNAGQGIHRQLPHLGDAGKGIRDYMLCLQNRLRRVRVCCGDWTRVLTPSVTFRHGLTGVFLDPPYGEGEVDYAAGGNRTDVAADVCEWAITNGDNPSLRIALCGYEGQHKMPQGWTEYSWKAAGGYSSTAANETQGKRNRHRERVWFSPHCLKPEEAATGLLEACNV